MNRLIFKTNIRVIDMCLEKLKIEKDKPSKLFNEKEFNYYYSVCERIQKETEEMQKNDYPKT